MGREFSGTIGGNLQTNNLTVELLNNGGEIDSGGNVSLEVSGNITARGDAIFEIQNEGGTMGQDGPIQVAAASISANSLLAQIDNSNGGVIDGNAHIFMSVPATQMSPMMQHLPSSAAMERRTVRSLLTAASIMSAGRF